MEKFVKKRHGFLILLASLSFCFPHSTNGVYLTKEDFINNKISCPFEKLIPAYGTNEYRIQSRLNIVLDNGKTIKFKANQIFGFHYNGRKYIFDSYWWGPSYLRVINETPVGIFISQDYSRQHEAFFRYSKNVGGNIKDLNEKNVVADFQNDNKLKAAMLDLCHILPSSFKPSEEDYNKYHLLIEHHFKKDFL